MKSRYFRSQIWTVLCLPVFVAGLAMAQQPPQNGYTVYAVTDLGTLPGYKTSEASGINNSGQVAGTAYMDTNLQGVHHAFLWQNGQLTDLGTLPGYDSTRALAINDKSQIVGTAENSSGNGGSHAFLWQNGQMTDLGTLGGSESSARAINNLGQIVGDSLTASGADHAFLWQDRQMTDLGTLGGADVDTVATGINDSGQVVGYSNFGEYTFLWQDGQMTDLGKLAPGFVTIRPPVINNKGQVAGSQYGADGSHAFLWQDGKFTDLGAIGSDPYGQVTGINESAQVVGGAMNEDHTFHPFLAENGQIIDLSTLLQAGSGWNLGYENGPNANGINNAGQIIASGDAAVPDYQEHALLLTAKPIVDADLQISPSPFTFGPVPIGKTSGPGVISIYNAGPQTAALASPKLAGGNTQFDEENGPPEFEITGTTCGPTLAANASCSVTLTLTPYGAGELTTFLVLNDNTKNSQQVVPISGGGSYLLKFTRLSWQFPTRPVGETSGSYVEYVYNPTGSAVHFTSIQLGGSNSGDFAITQNTCGSTLAPYTTCAVAFNFSPRARASGTPG
ncbi:MAG TPA: choice-of-anchor D domain-containing protein [Bryobacteraceae bacterium]|nr:choice-of-anchor D domain-containing protein [Bryobacteraceae bacterium]